MYDIAEPEFDTDNIDIDQLYKNVFINMNTSFNEYSQLVEENKNNREPELYCYKAVESLNTDILIFNELTKIHICAYQVNTEGLYPFLQYFMTKTNEYSENPEIISFPQFSYNSLMTSREILEICNCTLDIIFTCYHKNVITDSASYDPDTELQNDKYNYKGFVSKDNNMYIFFDCTEYKITSHPLHKSNDLWLVIIDEIVNQQKVCDYDIDDQVVDFFTEHADFADLHDDSSSIRYESPKSLYTYKYGNMSNFVLTFGQIKKKSKVYSDSYYLFSNYVSVINTINDIAKNTSINIKNNIGIIRFAVFVGNAHSTNFIADEFALQQTELFYKERNLWNNENDKYDSLYYTENDEDCCWAIKNYEQQVVLTMH